jgi:hypothetical protein
VANTFLFRAPRNENNIGATLAQCDRRITSVRIKFYNRRAPHKGDFCDLFFAARAVSEKMTVQGFLRALATLTT